MSYKFLFLGALFLSTLASAGPSVSGGGGGGGGLYITTMFSPAGILDVDLSSGDDGALPVVLKYFVWAGAQKTETFYSWGYEIPGSPGYISENKPMPGPIQFPKYMLRMKLEVQQLKEIHGGSTGSRIFFGGPMAVALYRGMANSGIQNSGSTRGPNNEFIAFIYRDGPLYCEKRASELCTISMIAK